ncbi:MAG TPA: NAD(+) synthase [Candidatus Avamphibacillus sp.]|nr:NAD(+) synthase [Candidatus Avamphibacillus sp.]
MEKVIDDIVSWLKQKVDETGVKGLVVGVSGGLDSAVVAHLIKKACPKSSLGVIMPLKSNPQDVEHANQVIESCDIQSVTIDLTETHQVMFDQIREQLKKDHNNDNEQMADANLRARLRMGTLYTIATNYNYLVVGTDNASEWYTGYFTKYGDGGVDIQPIIDFTKGEVKEMASFLGVPEEVVQKKPSADLWEGQTDEGEMGISYDVIDAYIKGEAVPEKDKKRIEQMHEKTMHKRSPLPQYHRKKLF